VAFNENINTASFRGRRPTANSKNDAVYVPCDDWCFESEFSIGIVDVLGGIKCYSCVYTIIHDR